MTKSTQNNRELLMLAERAGLASTWQDVYGQTHQVSVDVLHSLLDVLDLPCGSSTQIGESLHVLEQACLCTDGNMVVAVVDEPVIFKWQGVLSYRLVLESGLQHDGTATRLDLDTVSIDPVALSGYHQLLIGSAHLHLAIAPRRCPSVGELTGESVPRAWGVSAQIYSLRRNGYGALFEQEGRDAPFRSASPRSEALAQLHIDLDGAGDYTAVAMLAQQAAQQGASALSISPVHAMFSADPQRYSPYAPSSRLFLNTSYIDPALVFGIEAVESALTVMAKSTLVGQASSPPMSTANHVPARDTALIEWASVMPARLALCWQLHEQFCRRPPAALMQRFQTFRRKGGEALESHACYEALHAHFAPGLGKASGWRQWPIELHDSAGPQVRNFALQHEKVVQFHVFLQWLAHEGMRFAQKTARDAGMPIGLISDLAIGTDPRGSHAWSCQRDMIAGVSVGAPPDVYQSSGQNWGLSAFSPRALRAQAYAPFLDTLRAALAHAGGVRIDHILGLARMWVIPQGAQADQGVYLRYPKHDMLRLIALEASRHRAIVVGENLGTVPLGFNEQLYEHGILGTSVLWFERQAATAEEPWPDDPTPFTPPALWPSQAMATSTTHDLPTIEGWWQERDLLWHRQLDHIDQKELTRLQAGRHADREALWQALQAARCVSMMSPPAAAPRAEVLSFIAKTPAPLVIVPVEDLLGLADQPNLPGTSGVEPPFHPNWLQRLPAYVEQLFVQDETRHAVASVVRERAKS